MRPSRVVILASGNGTTAETFIRACVAGDINCQVPLVIASRSNAGIIGRIADLNTELHQTIIVKVIGTKTHPAAGSEHVEKGGQSQAEEQALLDELAQQSCDLVALMGYMKRIGPRLVDTYGWKPEYQDTRQASMLNTHPGLLPETRGLFGINVQEYVLRNHLKEAGQTLHVVAGGYDDGPIVAEHRTAVAQGETPDELFTRVQQIEKANIAHDIDNFASGKMRILNSE